MATTVEVFDDVIGLTETDGEDVTSDDTEGNTDETGGVTGATSVTLVDDCARNATEVTVIIGSLTAQTLAAAVGWVVTVGGTVAVGVG